MRIDDGAMLDGHEQVQQARAHLSDETTEPLAGILGCEPDKLEKELDTLAARAKNKALKVRITGAIRERARTGRYAFVYDRGPDFAASIWVIDPVFMLDLVREQLGERHRRCPRGRTRLLRRRQALRRGAARRGRRGPEAQSGRAPAPGRGGPQQPRARPRHRRRADRPHRRPAQTRCARSSATWSPTTTGR